MIPSISARESTPISAMNTIRVRGVPAGRRPARRQRRPSAGELKHHRLAGLLHGFEQPLRPRQLRREPADRRLQPGQRHRPFRRPAQRLETIRRRPPRSRLARRRRSIDIRKERAALPGHRHAAHRPAPPPDGSPGPHRAPARGWPRPPGPPCSAPRHRPRVSGTAAAHRRTWKAQPSHPPRTAPFPAALPARSRGPSGCARRPWGSATPLVSITMTSGRGSRRNRPASVRSRSPSSEQQMQPLLRLTTPSAAPVISSASILMAPKSLTTAAIRFPSACASKWFTTVVLPAPRNPATSTTGTGIFSPRQRAGAPAGRASPPDQARHPISAAGR